jgi:hypothetical protein
VAQSDHSRPLLIIGEGPPGVTVRPSATLMEELHFLRA